MLNSGIHRLSIAKILGIKEIPIQFIVRHKKWLKHRKMAIDSIQKAKEINFKKNSVDFSHPDLKVFKEH